jgi:apolipoprotein D and lipocalin family protein
LTLGANHFSEWNRGKRLGLAIALLPRVRTVIGCVLALFSAACASTTTAREGLPPLRSVSTVDLSRYVGVWYEIQSFPQSFQKDCFATTATYTARPDGEIDVLNRCRKGSVSGPEDSALGRARVVQHSGNAQLEVSFFRPFWGDYWIIELGEHYEYAVVGHPSRDYLWILSRTPTLDDSTLAGIIDRLREHKYDVTRLRSTVHASL